LSKIKYWVGLKHIKIFFWRDFFRKVKFVSESRVGFACLPAGLGDQRQKTGEFSVGIEYSPVLIFN
jgi:hypothetical protein